MKLHDLKGPQGATHNTKRKGRGMSSGLGKTSGRGHKGQNARSGGGVRLGFEGGQMPLYRRIPKRGFTNIWKKQIAGVNVSDLNRFEEGSTVTPEDLVMRGLVKGSVDGIKILGGGSLEKNLTVSAHAFSKVAVEKIEGAGGKALVI